MNIRKEKIKTLISRLFRLIEQDQPIGSGLGWGRSSLTMLYMYYGHYFKNESYTDKGIGQITKVFEDIGSENPSINSCNLFTGICGILTVLVNLRNSQLLDIDVESLKNLEELCFDWSLNEMKTGNLDFLNGGVGIFAFLLQKAQLLSNEGGVDPKFEEYCNEICRFLNDILMNKESFIVNKSYNKLDNQADTHVNFGLAHGLSGILISLIRLKNLGFGSGIEKSTIKNSIDKIVKLRETSTIPDPYYFASDIELDTKKVRFQRRLGWCHSDLNIIHLLSEYQSSIERDSSYEILITEAIQSVSLRDTYETNLLKDPFLCHGYAGLAHYYELINKIESNKQCSASYENYIDKTIEFYENHDDEHFFSDVFKKTSSCISFLYGNVGVALVLLSYLEPNSCKWSEIILL